LRIILLGIEMEVKVKVEIIESDWRDCKKCGSKPRDHEVRNYSMMWHDGDVYCLKCGAYVRMWDAG
jgi:hypothetical protein